jgi:hypothetical protein
VAKIRCASGFGCLADTGYRSSQVHEPRPARPFISATAIIPNDPGILLLHRVDHGGRCRRDRSILVNLDSASKVQHVVPAKGGRETKGQPLAADPLQRP